MSTAAAPAVRITARDRIFAAARELFYRHGIKAVGVESIAQEAGATKMSLYRAFESKDVLVAECLRDSERQFWAWWDAALAPFPGQPRAQLLSLFDAFVAKAKTCDTRGCPIGNAAVELSDDEHPGRKIVIAYNREKRRRLRELCRELGANEPDLLADSLHLLIEGGYMSRLTLGAAGPITAVRHAAEILIDAHLPRS